MKGLGGVAAIAISHPHYYSTMVEWSRAFGGVPIHLHAADRQWIMRPDPSISLWDGDTLPLASGVTLMRCGGHFAGGTVLHWAAGGEGRGALLSGDIVQLIPDRTHVSFMRSYPNIIPLSAPAVARIGAMLEPFAVRRDLRRILRPRHPARGQGRGQAFGGALYRHHQGRRHGGAAVTEARLRQRRRCGTERELMPSAPPIDPPQRSATAAFFAGFRAAWRSVMAYVLIGTYIGLAALAHDFGFSLWWLAASTVLVWAGPAQVILVSALGAGAAPVEIAIAVSLSSVRLLPMVISLLPLIKQPQTRNRDLLLSAHLTAVTHVDRGTAPPAAIAARAAHPVRQWPRAWASCWRRRSAAVIGYYLATSLPPLLSAALLFLTPMSFLISTTRNCRLLSDWLALVFGLVLGPLLAFWQVGLDLLWTGIVGGSLAYGIYRLREARR